LTVGVYILGAEVKRGGEEVIMFNREPEEHKKPEKTGGSRGMTVLLLEKLAASKV